VDGPSTTGRPSVRRAPNLMVPGGLLRWLRDAQRREVDGPEARAAVREIDRLTRCVRWGCHASVVRIVWDDDADRSVAYCAAHDPGPGRGR
jgi:hypothetical protein